MSRRFFAFHSHSSSRSFSAFLRRPARAAWLAAAGIATGPLAAQSTVVVTGAREPLAADRMAADVVVIDAETIRRSTADSLADLLRREAGLQLSRNGGPGQNSGVMIRGAAVSQTVVLVDGVRIGSATLGQAELEALGTEQIERIEVLRGPASSLYGADAVGGVVQIFTRRGSATPRLGARAAVGGYGSNEVSVDAGGTVGAWDLAASAAREASDGVSALRPGDAFGNFNPDDDGYIRSSAHARIGLTPAAGHRLGLTLLRTHLNSQYDASEYAPPAYAQDATPDFRNRLDTTVAALDWRGELARGWVASARLDRSIDELKSGATLIDRYRTTRTQGQAQLAWETGVLGQLVGAIERTEEKARSSSFGEHVERTNDAFVLALAGSARGWSWQAEARHDDASDFEAVTTGRVGGSVVLAKGLRLRALAATTYRAPSFNDLYYPGYGVATIEPERGRSIETGLEWNEGPHRAAVTLFRNRLRHLIGYESDRSYCPPDPAYDYGCARNVNRATLKGANLSGSTRQGALALAAQLDFLGAHDDATDKRLARRAANQQSVSADWDGGAWALGAALLRVGKRPDGGATLPADATLDLRALWRVAPAWTVEAKVLNLTDRDVHPALDYQGLGRQAWIGVRYDGKL